MFSRESSGATKSTETGTTEDEEPSVLRDLGEPMRMKAKPINNRPAAIGMIG
jgi:hypothetical protein